MVRINSPGGSVFDGVAIYNALKRHDAATTVWIDGIAADHAREEELGLKFGLPATAQADPAIEVDPEDRERPMQSEENAA